MFFLYQFYCSILVTNRIHKKEGVAGGNRRFPCLPFDQVIHHQIGLHHAKAISITCTVHCYIVIMGSSRRSRYILWCTCPTTICFSVIESIIIITRRGCTKNASIGFITWCFSKIRILIIVGVATT